MYKPTHEQRSSKCFVFVLAAFVMLSAILLVFASVVLRVRRPVLQLQSASVNRLSYSASPSPSYNLTMIAHLTINYPNFGSFHYENSSVIVRYDNFRVGDRELGSGTVKARETKTMNVTLMLRSNKLLFTTGNLTNDILLGTFNTKLTGTVHLLKILKKNKSTDLACSIHLNLTSHSIHNFQC